MPDITDVKLPLTTPDITAELLERLHEVAPQVFCEGKIDFDKLKAALGATLEERTERYGLSWAGKSEAFRNVQIPSVATLLPQPAESVAWETTENQIIEGDNLEVLKLLQKPYHGKIKMIYIDPPYNTGNEFIYPDNFREGLKDYLRYSGQVSEEGVKQTTNTETSGRFHSNWLSMMYPRLFLARNLLREDGVIFVSIDDNEVHNLRLLMNEVFGEENFVSIIVIQANKRGQTYKEIAKTHEYILVYSRGDSSVLYELEKDGDALPFQDSIGPFDLWELRNRNPKFGRHNRPNLYYPIYAAPSVRDECGYAKVSLTASDVYAVEVWPRNSAGDDGCWRWGKQKINTCDLLHVTPILVAKQRRDGEWNIYEKSRKSTTKAKSLWDETEVISEQGTIQVGLLGLGDIFDHPKPIGLISKCLRVATKDDDLVLDFFAGSGTTAQAVLELNKKDSGNRKYILVQLPEKTENLKFPTIAHITRERVRRVIDKLNKEETGKLDLTEKQDRGFRAFKLTSSNFKIWDADTAPTDTAALAEQLKLYADNVEDSRDQQDILFELILKTGLPLSSRIATIAVAGGTAYSIADGKLLICLENPVTREMLRAMTALKPTQMLCLDIAFHGDDALKTNTVLETRAHGVVFRTV